MTSLFALSHIDYPQWVCIEQLCPATHDLAMIHSIGIILLSPTDRGRKGTSNRYRQRLALKRVHVRVRWALPWIFMHKHVTTCPGRRRMRHSKGFCLWMKDKDTRGGEARESLKWTTSYWASPSVAQYYAKSVLTIRFRRNTFLTGHLVLSLGLFLLSCRYYACPISLSRIKKRIIVAD